MAVMEASPTCKIWIFMADKNIFSNRKPRNPKDAHAARPARQPAPRILLVCEGEKTEPSYFRDLINKWNLNNQVKIGNNDGSSPDKVVEKAEELFDLSKSENDAFDEVYCIFDRDAHEKFFDAVDKLKTLKSNGKPLQGIISIPCFEFWLLLHFGYTSKPYASKGKKSIGDAVVSDLKKKSGFSKYKKRMTGVFELLEGKLDDALKYSERLAKEQKDDGEHCNPSTKIHELVNRLKLISDTKIN